MTRLTQTIPALLLSVALLAGCSGSKQEATPPVAGTATPAAGPAAGPAAAPAAATPVPPPPQIKARSFIVIDGDSGRVLAALDPDSRQEPRASRS